MRRLPGDHQDYLSIDTVEGEEEFQRDMYPVEFLNTIAVSGLLPHRLRFKVGVPVLLMRNLAPESGLCIGTRLLITRLATHCIHATIMNGTFKGQATLILRISSREIGLPFQIKRKQFPVQVAFAMTIKKAQGQSVTKLAVYLPQPVFSHDQFFVALSRATSRANVRLLIRTPEKPEGLSGSSFTRNLYTVN
jgi:ATP-dependent DNA helicase PIF1